jgi:broad specificity phosphatase PhoE
VRLIAVVRHGEEEPGGSVMQARSPRPLSPRGRAQAEAAARFLASLTDAAVIASDLPRALETAQVIAGSGREVGADPRLAPIDLGDWEGGPDARLDDLAAEIQRPGGCAPGGESLARLRDRAAAALEDARRSDRHLVIVAHRLPNAVLIAEAMGIPVDHAWQVQQSPGGVSLLIDEGGRLRLGMLNVSPDDPLRRDARAVSVV